MVWTTLMVAMMAGWPGLITLVGSATVPVATVEAIDYRNPTVQSLFSVSPYFINPYLDLSEKYGSNTAKEE
jgi:hypothetical protein